jgi:hypothetical protein
MDVHCEKILTENLEKILNEGGRFQVRHEDENEPKYKVGDHLWLYEYFDGYYVHRIIECKITYIHRGYGLQKNFCILGFDVLLPERKNSTK